MKKTAITIICSLALFGCVSHNTPDRENPNVVFVGGAESFVDQNGSFYPDNWEVIYGTPRPFGAYSLNTIAERKGIQEDLEDFNEKTIKDLQSYLSEKDRIFILIHGFNNDAKTSRHNYCAIRKRMHLNDHDGVVEFYWDGLVANDVFGSAKIWFNAAGYSQLAGTNGLRSILNAVSNKQIVIVSHSRGASVVLSALSNPPYAPDFAEDTWTYHHIDVHENEVLENNNNRIKAIFLAPAIGHIDFRKPDYYDAGDKDAFRELNEQLVGIDYTVNPNDPVLQKYIEFAELDTKFNPTDLGYNPKAGRVLNVHYGNMKAYMLCDMHGHAFIDYIEHPTFQEILAENGVGVKSDLSP